MLRLLAITLAQVLTLLVGVLLNNGAVAQSWDEFTDGGGDAPGLTPGQITVGSGPLLTITGSLDNPDFDPDLYCIRITDPANFSASTVGSVSLDLSLWLFDVNADGIAHDGADDTAAGPNAGYQASLSNQFVPSPGIYFLAVTRGGIDALANGNEIWADLPTFERSPDGPGAPGLLSAWDFPGYGLAGSYSIQLTGSSYHIPEPTGAALAVFGALGLLRVLRCR